MGDFRVCIHEIGKLTLLVCLGIMSVTWPCGNSILFVRINRVQSVLMSSCNISINEHFPFSKLWKIIFVSISESQSQSIAVVVTVVTSEILCNEPDESSSHSNIDN
jgi:hypothetical protein